MKHTLAIIALLGLIGSHTALAQAPQSTAKPAAPARPSVPGVKPTLANVPYGSDPKQVLDFYKAESNSPTPLLFFIHGGGWVNGSKSGVSGLRECLAAGISVVSVEYRFIQQAMLAGAKPPFE